MYLLRQLKKDMEFNQDLLHILEVFKNIAVSELHKLQTKRRKVEDFWGVLEGFFAAVDWNKCFSYPLLRQDKTLPQALVAITSDEGFSGGLNSIVLSKTLSLISPVIIRRSRHVELFLRYFLIASLNASKSPRFSFKYLYSLSFSIFQ